MRLGARALLGLFGAISLAVAKVVIVESGTDYFFFRILAAARLGLRRLAPALTSGVDFTILLAAFAVLLDIEPGAEDIAVRACVVRPPRKSNLKRRHMKAGWRRRAVADPRAAGG